jgi:hypothetical protein
MPSRTKPDAVRFLILTAGRSGSTLLGDALQTHPDVLCFGELLEEPELEGLKSKDVILREIESHELPETYLDKTVYGPQTNGYKAVGFRVKHYHFDGNDLAKYALNSGLRIIHSKRRNLIAQSLSVPLAFEHEFGDWRGDSIHQGRYTRRVTVDVDDVIYRCEDNLEREKYFDELFSTHLPFLDVYYHDLCHTDKTGCLTNRTAVDQVLAFLNLEAHSLKTVMLKQRRKPYAYLIANYNELRNQALRVHPEWRGHFEELEADESLF